MRRNEKKGNADNDGSDAMSAVTEQSGPSVPALSGRQTLVAATASLFGWGLDLFDLFILLFVAPIVGKLFFPANNPMLSLAGAYASFAVTLLIRPLGSALFGSYADRKGRRMAMMIAVTGVGLSTASFGLLPTVV
jgi:MFS transporter, MHS family, proline/betaine transporter